MSGSNRKIKDYENKPKLSDTLQHHRINTYSILTPKPSLPFDISNTSLNFTNASFKLRFISMLKHSYHNNNTLHKYEYHFVLWEARVIWFESNEEEVRSLFYIDLLELKRNHFYGTICLEKCKLLSGFYERSRFFSINFVSLLQKNYSWLFFISTKSFMRQASVKAEKEKSLHAFSYSDNYKPFVCARNQTEGLTVHKSNF